MHGIQVPMSSFLQIQPHFSAENHAIVRTFPETLFIYRCKTFLRVLILKQLHVEHDRNCTFFLANQLSESSDWFQT